MIEPFDFTTNEILDWELEMIQNALDKQEIEITQHAADAAEDDNLTLIQLLEAVLVGVPVSKDLPDNELQRLIHLSLLNDLCDPLGKVGHFFHVYCVSQARNDVLLH